MRSLLFICVILFNTSYRQDPGTTITWRPQVQLTWDDFKGPRQHRDAVASTTYDIVHHAKNEQTHAKVEITAVFYPYDSWHNKLRNDKVILAHEQKHFDIAELFARKLRKKISAETFANYAEVEMKLKSLHTTNDREMDRYQDLYDAETDYSREPGKQEAWNEKIENELLLLSGFSSPLVILPYNASSRR